MAAMTSVPAHTDSLAYLPTDNALTDSVDDSRYFVSGHSRVLNHGPKTFLGKRVAMTNPASLNLDPR